LLFVYLFLYSVS